MKLFLLECVDKEGKLTWDYGTLEAAVVQANSSVEAIDLLMDDDNCIDLPRNFQKFKSTEIGTNDETETKFILIHIVEG